jgi:hypothetical protein
MTQPRKSESIVSVNAKLTAFDLKHLRYRDASVVVEEGRFVIEDGTTGFGRLAIGTDGVAYVNFLVSSAPSVLDEQTDPFDPSAPVQALEAGGLAGICGAGIELGIPMNRWFDTTTNPPAVGKHVCLESSAGYEGMPEAIATGALSGRISFGVITRIVGQQVMFLFNAVGVRY